MSLSRNREFVILWRPPNELAAEQAESYQREVTMDEKKFKEELEKAKYFQKCDDEKRDYWMGYILGLNRGFYGENFQCPFDALTSSQEPKGAGFRDGLKFIG